MAVGVFGTRCALIRIRSDAGFTTEMAREAHDLIIVVEASHARTSAVQLGMVLSVRIFRTFRTLPWFYAPCTFFALIVTEKALFAAIILREAVSAWAGAVNLGSIDSVQGLSAG